MHSGKLDTHHLDTSVQPQKIYQYKQTTNSIRANKKIYKVYSHDFLWLKSYIMVTVQLYKIKCEDIT